MAFNADRIFVDMIDSSVEWNFEEEKKKESKCKGNITYYRKWSR